MINWNTLVGDDMAKVVDYLQREFTFGFLNEEVIVLQKMENESDMLETGWPI